MLTLSKKLIILSAAVILTLGALIFSLTATVEKAGAEAQSSVIYSPYTLKCYEEKVAIFEGSNPVPILTLDIQLSQLPEKDQAKLEKGITAQSLAEIISIAENYE